MVKHCIIPALPRRRFLWLMPGFLWAPVGRAAAPRPLQIGIMPYLSTAQLIAGHQGLRHYIEKTFARPATLSTAPDFPAFQQRTLAGEYDLVVTGPPLAWAAHKAGVMRPVAIAARPLRIVIVVAQTSPVRALADLRGQAVGVLPPPSFAPAILTSILRDHGLQPGTDVELRYDRTPYNSVKAAILGELAAAAYPTVSLPSLPAELLAQVRTLHTSIDYPAAVMCVRLAPDLPSPVEMQTALFNFARNTPEGRAFVQEFGHDGLLAPDLEAMKILDRFLPNAR